MFGISFVICTFLYILVKRKLLLIYFFQTMEKGFGDDTVAEFQRGVDMADREAVDGQLDERRGTRLVTCTGFEVADWQKAKIQKKNHSNRYYKDNQVSPYVSLPFLKMYGTGIYLFFAFLWEVSKFFIMLSLISVVPIVYNYVEGNAFTYSETSLQMVITRTTIGNFQYSALTASNAGSISLQHKYINAGADMLSCAVFITFFFHWERKSRKIIKEIQKQIVLPSERTVEVIQFHERANAKQIEQFMSKFGTVCEVAVVKNYSEQIRLSKDIYELEMEMKDLTISYEASPEQETGPHNKKMTQLQKKKSKLEKELENDHGCNGEIIKFYVCYETVQQKLEVLKLFMPYQKACSCCLPSPPEDMLLGDEKVVISNCKTEPGSVIWENVHINWGTRWMRLLLQFLLILLIIAICFCAISFLNVLTPHQDTNVSTDSYTWADISVESNTTIVEAWCIKNIYASDTYSSVCSSYWSEYVRGIIYQVCISFVIIIFKFIVQKVMVGIAKFQRYTDHTEQSVTITTNLFLTYISTTVLITFLMQAYIFKISFKSLVLKLTSNTYIVDNLNSMNEFSDLTSTWYNEIGYQIWFNMLIESLIPHLILPVVHYAKQCFNESQARKQVLHKNMLRKMESEDFQIEDFYAQVLMIVFVGFMFGGGVPAMIPVCLLGLLSRYVYCKYVFIRFCRIPKTFRESLNDRALKILQITFFCRGFLSIYMYGASDIFVTENSSIASWGTNIDIAMLTELTTFISRIFLTWYYSLFVAILLAVFILKDTLIQLIMSACSKDPTFDESTRKKQSEEESVDAISVMEQRSLTKSYKLENNPDYIQILAIMKMRRRHEMKMARESIVPQNVNQQVFN